MEPRDADVVDSGDFAPHELGGQCSFLPHG